MKPEAHLQLSRRERQIMDLLFREGRLTAAEVRERLPGSPSSSTVRTLLRVLEEKGHARHQVQELRYVYTPVVGKEAARRSALRHLLDTFFHGSAHEAVTALIDEASTGMSGEQLSDLEALIAKARKEGR